MTMRRLWRAAREIAPDHPLYRTTHFLGAWMAMILGTSLSTGGAVMPELLILLGLSLALFRCLDVPPSPPDTPADAARSATAPCP
jgi:hypothetical protein